MFGCNIKQGLGGVVSRYSKIVSVKKGGTVCRVGDAGYVYNRANNWVIVMLLSGTKKHRNMHVVGQRTRCREAQSDMMAFAASALLGLGSG